MTEPETVSGRVLAVIRSIHDCRKYNAYCDTCEVLAALDAATQETDAALAETERLRVEVALLEDHKAMLNTTLSAVVETRDKLRRDHDAALAETERLRAEVARPRFIGAHLSHCNRGEHPGACKYGDSDCPALDEDVMEFLASLRDDTIERCARVADEIHLDERWNGDDPAYIAAAIRALPRETT